MIAGVLIAVFAAVVALAWFMGDTAAPLIAGSARRSQQQREAKIKAQFEESFIFWDRQKVPLLYSSPLVFALVGFLLLRGVLGLALGFAAGIAFPYVMLAIGKRQRVHKFQGQIVDSLMILSSSLRAGLSFLQAIEVLCEEMPAPVSQEFRLVLHEQKLGRSIEDALGNLRKRMRLEETNLVVSSILIARETGGDLPRVLSRLADTIRDNLKLKEKISTLTLQGRLQGVIMAMLPFAFAYFIYKQNPGHFDVMLETELGRKLLAGAAILQIVGIILIKKVSTMKF